MRNAVRALFCFVSDFLHLKERFPEMLVADGGEAKTRPYGRPYGRIGPQASSLTPEFLDRLIASDQDQHVLGFDCCLGHRH